MIPCKVSRSALTIFQCSRRSNKTNRPRATTHPLLPNSIHLPLHLPTTSLKPSPMSTASDSADGLTGTRRVTMVAAGRVYGGTHPPLQLPQSDYSVCVFLCPFCFNAGVLALPHFTMAVRLQQQQQQQQLANCFRMLMFLVFFFFLNCNPFLLEFIFVAFNCSLSKWKKPSRLFVFASLLGCSQKKKQTNSCVIWYANFG